MTYRYACALCHTPTEADRLIAVEAPAECLDADTGLMAEVAADLERPHASSVRLVGCCAACARAVV